MSDLYDEDDELDEDLDEEGPGLGLCCYCRERDASVIWFTPYRLPPEGQGLGRGWGCLVCGLGADGAMAVFCEPCASVLEADTPEAKAWLAQPVVCIGYSAENRRQRLTEPEPFGHDVSRHPEMQEED